MSLTDSCPLRLRISQGTSSSERMVSVTEIRGKMEFDGFPAKTTSKNT